MSAGSKAHAIRLEARVRLVVHADLTVESAATLRRILDLMGEASLCAFGRETTGPVRTVLDRFGPQVIAGLERSAGRKEEAR